MVNIEDILQGLKVRYTKQEDTDGADRFSAPYNTSGGVVSVTILPRPEPEVSYVRASVLLRTLDSVVTGSAELFLQGLLKLNHHTRFARVVLYTDPDEKVDWIVVDSGLPYESLTESTFTVFMSDLLGLTEKVMQAIASNSSPVQNQPVRT